MSSVISFCKEQNILDIKIKDNYIRFWFAFVYPNLSFIESGNSGIAMNKIRKGLVSRHRGLIHSGACTLFLLCHSRLCRIPHIFRIPGKFASLIGCKTD